MKKEKKSPTHSALRRQLPEEPRWGWLRQPGIGNAALPGTADNAKCFPPILPQREKGWKTILSTANVETPC